MPKWSDSNSGSVAVVQWCWARLVQPANGGMMGNRKDMALVILCPLIASAVSLFQGLGLLGSTFLYFSVPACWLSFRNRGRVQLLQKIALFAFVLTVPLTIVIDYILVINEVWHLPSSAFPFRLLGQIAIEQFVWTFSFVYFIILFYEHFFEVEQDPYFLRKVAYLISFFLIVLLAFFAILAGRPSLMLFPHTYFWVGLSFVVAPMFVFLLVVRRFPFRFLPTTLYFLVTAVLFEYVGLHLEQWIFTGRGILYSFSFFGQLLPLEELVCWWFLAPCTVLALYKFPIAGLHRTLPLLHRPSSIG